MKIGIIGAGNIGKAFAAHASKAGYNVVISSSKDVNALEPVAQSIGSQVKAGSVADAVDSDVVLIAVPFGNVKDAVAGYNWSDKIVIDATNAISMPGMELIDTDGKNSSEINEEYVKGAKVVKAFNTLPAGLMAADPKLDQGNRVLFYSGNDADANKTVGGIIDSFGFAGIDLGRLNEGGKLQQLIIGSLSLQNLIKGAL